MSRLRSVMRTFVCLHGRFLGCFCLRLGRGGLRFLLLQLAAEFTAGADAVAVSDEDERRRAHQQADEAEQTTGPSDAEVVVQGLRRERQDDAEQTAGAGRGGEGAGGVDLVRINDVVELAHEDQQEGQAEGQGGERGHDPMNADASGPAEPEQGDDEQWAPKTREGKSSVFLLLSPFGGVCLVFGAIEVAVPPVIEDSREQGAHTDG
nr:hypothetical protein CFP56_30923 [Quercus suber]